MTTPSDSNIVPSTDFDPVVFWVKHKTKIVVYGALLLIAIAAYTSYTISAQNKLKEGRAALLQASTAEDYRAIIQRFPKTAAAGDASLLLAEKLRTDKKYDEAIAVLQSTIDTNSDYLLIDGVWLSLGSTYAAQGNTDQALATFRQVSAKFSSRYSAPQAMLAEAEVLQAKGSIEEAKHAYENVQSQFPGSYFTGVAMQKLQLLKK